MPKYVLGHDLKGEGARLELMSALLDPMHRRYIDALGVVKPGAFADLLLVDGDPIANIKLVEDPGKNFVVIMKDGKIYKNILK